MTSNKSLTEFEIGKQIIKSSVKLDESLAQLLQLKVQVIKKSLKNNDTKEIEELHKLLKIIILALTMTDEKMKYGIQLCNYSKIEQID